MARRSGPKIPGQGKISINRPSYGDGREVITITIEDVVSGIEFVEAHISYSDFTRALTGQSSIPCDLRLMNLSSVGKIYVSESAAIEVPSNLSYQKSEIQEWISANHKRDGWFLNSGLGSQRSLVHDGKGGTTANVYYYCWMTQEEHDQYLETKHGT